jgi:methyl-accepting chemotaxis protein
MRLQSKLILILLSVSIVPLLVESLVIYTMIPDQVQQKLIFDSLLLFGFITITTIVALAIFIAKTITRSVRTLHTVSQKIAQGNFEIEVPDIHSNDEIADLGKAFNEMISKLKRSYAALDSSNQQLKASNQQLLASNQQLDASTQQLRAANEQLSVAEKDLRERVNELEIFNRATVGRELKMIELKKEIAQLKEQNKKDE